MAARRRPAAPAGDRLLTAPHPPLFPPIAASASGFLERDAGHRLYWEQSGRQDGMPVVFLHGGPGAGSSPVHRQFFDPAHYRIILFDQRGAGRSTPRAETAANTTDHLVDDMEALRRHLGIDRWLVFGGSWGATLALAYGIRHAGRCAGFVLRGIFLGTDAELDWFLHGMSRFFPEAWRAFAEFVPAAERDDLLTAYRARLIDPDPAVHRPAAQAWVRYEMSCSTLLPPTAGSRAYALDGTAALSLARISTHYFWHHMFLGPIPLVDRLAGLSRLPCIIVQGRYDMVCPLAAADRLHGAWPGSELVVVPDAGHSAFEPGTRAALVAATQRMKAVR